MLRGVEARQGPERRNGRSAAIHICLGLENFDWKVFPGALRLAGSLPAAELA
jgi:hypothetical protein